MGYIGENKLFSFRNGYCETLPSVTLTSADAASLGRVLSRFFNRFSAACDSFGHVHLLYALCCGLSECGRDVYVSENTDLPSFRFSFPLLSSDCGIYISGSGSSVKLQFFAADRFPLSDKLLAEIMNGQPSQLAEKNGKLTPASSFREIYTNNITDSVKGVSVPIPAGVSCGNKSVRSLWLEFFSGENDDLVFQVSEDGQRVNAYSTEAGFISYEKLLLACAVKTAEENGVVWLPNDFHYAAELAESSKCFNIKRFQAYGEIPEAAAYQRFMYDPLFMAVMLSADKDTFIRDVKALPQLSAAKREVTVSDIRRIPENKSINDWGGRVIISRSGKNRVSLLAQSFSSETAAELCSSWTEKLRKMGSFGI